MFVLGTLFGVGVYVLLQCFVQFVKTVGRSKGESSGIALEEAPVVRTSTRALTGPTTPSSRHGARG